MTAVVVAITLAVAGGALILLGDHNRQTAGTASTASIPGRQELIQIVGVLRRPQTKADLPGWLGSGLTRGPIAVLQGEPDFALVRYATTTPWGEKLYLVPRKPATTTQLASLARRFPADSRLIAHRRRSGETLSVMSRGGEAGAANAAGIAASGLIETEGAGHSFAGGSSETRIILVVPDGVAKVEFVTPRQPQPGLPGAPVYAHSLRVTVPVHNNVAAVQIDRETDGGAEPMVWYAADGAVLKRIGDFGTVNGVSAPPKPGPETALSLAAQRDPSTPNRVWVTPSVGGPHTSFMLHFRVLLNDADYSYRLTGTSCPAITVNGGDGGGGALGLRGRIWSDVVDAVAGQSWCPGTYHLSAAVMDLGRYGALKHPAKPFGAATFVVR